MVTHVPPVIRENFYYQDNTFTVDVGGPLKRHARASPAEIEDYASNKVTGRGGKDQTAHWYEAQLIHYGLSRSKDKHLAKSRLMEAINNGKGGLKQPIELAEREADMKKEFAKQARKVGKGVGEASGGKTPAGKVSQKRKRGDGNEVDGGEDAESSTKTKGPKSKKTNDDVTAVAGAKKKKAAVDTSDAKVRGVKGTASATPARARAQTKKASSSNIPAESNAMAATKADGENGSKKQAPAKKGATPKESESAPKPATKKQAKSKASEASSSKPTATSSKASKTNSKNPASDNMPTSQKQKAAPKPAKQPTKPKSEPKVKKEPIVASPSPSPPRVVKQELTASYHAHYDGDIEMEDAYTDTDSIPRPHPSTITGVYNLAIPQITNLDEALSSPRLFLHYDEDADALWGKFTFSNRSGILRVHDLADQLQSYDESGGIIGSMQFEWRAKNELKADGEPGRLKFGRGCVGTLELLGGPERAISGDFTSLFRLGVKLKFNGSARLETIGYCGLETLSFEEEWDNYVAEAYGTW